MTKQDVVRMAETIAYLPAGKYSAPIRRELAEELLNRVLLRSKAKRYFSAQKIAEFLTACETGHGGFKL